MVHSEFLAPTSQNLHFAESPLSRSRMKSARDIPLIITSAASSSERRITPSWTVAQLKSKLEPLTGIPPASQRLVLRTSDQAEQVIEAGNEDEVQIWRWPLTGYAEIHVTTLDPQAPNLIPSETSAVPKYTMPVETYSALPNTVLAYKKTHNIGRFDPNGPEIHQKKVQQAWKDIGDRSK
ncbi:MAG: hypothetical protein Q9191_004600 [Dirinaria sp. TL-2023a]